MDRYWLITWTTYGTWLPGDKRGFVGPVIDDPETRTKKIENRPQTEYLSVMPALRRYAASELKGAPIYLTAEQSEQLAEQLIETATYRKWNLCSFAIMSNHVHLVVGVNGDPEPDTLLRDFKSYGSRKLNGIWGKPENGTWWTESGSTRKLPDEAALIAANRYVENQENPLVLFVAEEFKTPE